MAAIATGTDYGDASDDLFNGNISKMVTAISPINGQAAVPVQGNAYRYDQLNRILSSESFQGMDVITTNSFINATSVNNGDYRTDYTYDANGNILTLKRNGHSAQAQQMDDMRYFYERDANGKLLRNRLLHVKDAIPDTNYTEDIDDQGIFYATQPNTQNYGYDEIGNLIRDNAEEIQEITWRVDGKVQQVIRTPGSTKPDLLFKYDAMGNRITKAVFHKSNIYGDTDVTYTHYVRDATGNVMSTYKRTQRDITATSIVDTISLSEQHLYGSSRLGIRRMSLPLTIGTYQKNSITVLGEYSIYGTPLAAYTAILDTTRTHRPLGAKNYELSNHLGNVLATVSDRKLWDNANNEFIADVTSATDYYPFGMGMIGRNLTGGHRYGFNSQEKDNEILENGNSYTAQFWQYDARLGRRWNIDPKPNPSISEYACFANNPIMFSDPLGDTIRVSGNFGFKMRIHFQLTVLRVLASKEIRHMVKDLRRDNDIVNIDNLAPPGTSPNARISLFAKKKYYRRVLIVRKVKTSGKIKFMRTREMPTLANELSHKHDSNVGAIPAGNTNFRYKNQTEATQNFEIKSNRIENLVHKRFLSRTRVEGTHYGALFANQTDVRNFRTLVRRRYRDNKVNARRLAKHGVGGYTVKDTTTDVYNRSSATVKNQYDAWRGVHID